jgi:HD-like signal output (HDOD) protein/prolyl-tRNA editing enzyme YbaK/EbsC (Cys-tRNA(Pro) deacylase)
MTRHGFENSFMSTAQNTVSSAASAAGTNIPQAIESLLKTWQVAYGVTDAPLVDDNSAIGYRNCSGATRLVLLGDAKGQLQAIVPAGDMLDLQALQRLTGRELRALPLEEVQAIVAAKELLSLPALPQITGLPTVVDAKVLAMTEVVLESGISNKVIRLKGESFKVLLAEAVIGDIARPMPPAAAPADVDDVSQIRQAVGEFTSKRIAQRLEDTLEFPPLPQTAARIIKLRVDANADVRDLSDIVEIDPSLAAQVVSWAASPYYAAPGKIRSVHDAIVRVLGFDLVMNLALGLALGRSMKMPKDNPVGFLGYWHQAVYASAVIEELVKRIPPKYRPVQGIACLGGLLHNFGYLVLAEVFPPQFSMLCRLVEANPQAGHSSLERHLIGIDREQIGAWLMTLWNMPDEVCIALRHQNNGDYNGAFAEYANLVFVATRMLKAHGLGDCPLEAIPDAMFERLHLDREEAEAAVREVVSCAEEIQGIADNLAA